MRAVSTPRLIWPARRLPSLLLSATLFAWLPRAALAQETELKLRLSEQLSPGVPRPEAPSPLAPPAAQETELELRLSEQLSPGAPRVEAPSPLATPAPPVAPAPQPVMEMLLQVDVNRQQ